MSRGLLVWLVIMACETFHGILRSVFLVPRVGDIAASRIGWPIGMAIVLGVTALLIRWTGLKERRDLISLGAIWAVLTFAFEIAIGLLRGLGWPRIWAEINPMAGGLVIYSLAVMFAAPLLAARLRNVRS